MSDTSSFHVNVHLNEDDHVASLKNYLRKQSIVVHYLGGWTNLLLPLAFAAWSVSRGPDGVGAWWLLVPASLWVIAVLQYLCRSVSMSKFAATAAAREHPSGVSVDQAGITVRDPDGQVHQSWRRARHIDTTRTHAFIDFGGALVILPARCFDSPGEFKAAVASMRAFRKSALARPEGEALAPMDGGVSFAVSAAEIASEAPGGVNTGRVSWDPAIVAVSLLFFAGAIVSWIIEGAATPGGAIRFAGIGVTVAIIGVISPRLAYREICYRAVRDAARLAGTHELEPSRTGVHFRRAGLDSWFRWSAFSEAPVTDESIVLRFPSGGAIVVPARSLDAATFANLGRAIQERYAASHPSPPEPPSLLEPAGG